MASQREPSDHGHSMYQGDFSSHPPNPRGNQAVSNAFQRLRASTVRLSVQTSGSGNFSKTNYNHR